MPDHTFSGLEPEITTPLKSLNAVTPKQIQSSPERKNIDIRVELYNNWNARDFSAVIWNEQEQRWYIWR